MRQSLLFIVCSPSYSASALFLERQIFIKYLEALALCTMVGSGQQEKAPARGQRAE
jgi:hypothetical protein